MGSQQLLMPSAHICQALAVGSSSPGQLLLTAVVRRPNVLQSTLQECSKGCGCRCLAYTICIVLEEVGWGQGLAGPHPYPDLWSRSSSAVGGAHRVSEAA